MLSSCDRTLCDRKESVMEREIEAVRILTDRLVKTITNSGIDLDGIDPETRVPLHKGT